MGNLFVVFHAFLHPVISTAPFSFSFQKHFGGVGDSDLQRCSSTALARPLFLAASVSLIVFASRSSDAKLISGLRYFAASLSDFSFSYGVE